MVPTYTPAQQLTGLIAVIALALVSLAFIWWTGRRPR